MEFFNSKMRFINILIIIVLLITKLNGEVIKLNKKYDIKPNS